MLRLVLLTQIACLSLAAQTASGIAPAWDVRQMLRQLAENIDRYKTTVEQLKVNEWMSKGAPDAYQRQLRVVQTEAGHLRTVSAKLAEDPERLSLVVDTLFRLEYVESITASLAEAATRYEDPQAQPLGELLNRNAASRTKLRQYLLDLSHTKEQEFATAHNEAQRCMTVLNQNPLSKPAASSPRAKTPAAGATAAPPAAPVKK